MRNTWNRWGNVGSNVGYRVSASVALRGSRPQRVISFCRAALLSEFLEMNKFHSYSPSLEGKYSEHGCPRRGAPCFGGLYKQ